MSQRETEVVIIGGGAAGIAAAKHLHTARVDCLLVEARDRLGGRGWSVAAPGGGMMDLGCGWLHSADRNPWAAVAQAQGRVIDKTRPPWSRPSPAMLFPLSEQRDYYRASGAFHERLEATVDGPDRPAADRSQTHAIREWTNEPISATRGLPNLASISRISLANKFCILLVDCGAHPDFVFRRTGSCRAIKLINCSCLQSEH
jgi:monoamine oxidase